jgi:hypothetical protein
MKNKNIKKKEMIMALFDVILAARNSPPMGEGIVAGRESSDKG